MRLFVEWQTTRVEATLNKRRVQAERAYIASSGLVLQIRDARHDAASGQHFHYFRSTLQAAGALALRPRASSQFLKSLQPGAKLNEVGRPGIEVKKFQLQHLGAAVTAPERVFTRLDLPLSGSRLM